MKRPIEEDSDSENDDDYIPGKDDNSDSSDSESSIQGEESSEPRQAEEVEDKKDLNEVWKAFQESVASQPTSSVRSNPEEKLVKVVKKYRFAGEEQEEIIEVLEGSEDAKRWPRYLLPDPALVAPSESPATSASTPLASATPPTSSLAAPQTRPPQRKPPGPRKPKTTLAPLPSSSANKAKKLTTLERSSMDWTAHVQSSGQKSELEMNRKSGSSYLEKVDFLNRVDERKEELLDNAGSSTKRRKL